MTVARRAWRCPECGAGLTALAHTADAADAAMLQVVREHVGNVHASSAHLTNSHAQATGWLAAAGHLVELWGGPHDGAMVWCPPGPLPQAIGVKASADGQLVPVPASWLRRPGVDPYVLGIDGLGDTAADRYVWTP